MSALLEVNQLTVDFTVRGARTGGILGRDRPVLRAVDRVSLQLERGTGLGLVGESGSGKTTLARTVVGLTTPTSGEILIDGSPVERERPPQLRRRVQMVFQDPAASLNPAFTVERTLMEPMLAHGLGSQSELRDRCRELLAMVELSPAHLRVRSTQLSGGQRQRVAIARALTLEPELLVADEAVTALDVSVQAAVVNLLARLRRELNLTILFIAHDLAVVRQVCDRIAVMYLGAIVEEGPADAVLDHPQHPYTRALLAAVPRLEARTVEPYRRVTGEPPSPLAIPSGCRFRSRCSLADPTLCAEVEPKIDMDETHSAACHFAGVESRSASAST